MHKHTITCNNTHEYITYITVYTQSQLDRIKLCMNM